MVRYAAEYYTRDRPHLAGVFVADAPDIMTVNECHGYIAHEAAKHLDLTKYAVKVTRIAKPDEEGFGPHASGDQHTAVRGGDEDGLGGSPRVPSGSAGTAADRRRGADSVPELHVRDEGAEGGDESPEAEAVNLWLDEVDPEESKILREYALAVLDLLARPEERTQLPGVMMTQAVDGNHYMLVGRLRRNEEKNPVGFDPVAVIIPPHLFEDSGTFPFFDPFNEGGEKEDGDGAARSEGTPAEGP